MENIKRNILIILNQIVSYPRLKAMLEDDYCCRVYEWICNKQYDKLQSIIPDPGKYREQISLDFLKKQTDEAGNKGIRIITISDRDYPEKLKNIHQPPPVLYINGELSQDLCLGIVGTRKATAYGRNAVSRIVSDLVPEDITIISGMAYGIDYYAHKYCLENDGNTIAVLGTGMDIIYPSQNKALYYLIIERGGTLVSEFPIGYAPTKYSFLQRNRIISGLSDGVLVIESKTRGGALSTANFALDQGKDVFSVPGSIFSAQSVGCNNLIKQGAIPVTDGDDILFVLKSSAYSTPISGKKETKNGIYSISDSEEKILEMIEKGFSSFDGLMDNLNFDIGLLYNLLFNMEQKGYIQREAGNRYIRIHCKGDI